MPTTPGGVGGGSGDDPVTPAEIGAVAQVFVIDLDALEVAPEDRHHLAQVLRLRPGETVVASDGVGGWRVCVFTGGAGTDTPGASMLEPVGPVVTTARAAPVVTVAFVPVKGERPEWVVQKLTEAGVDRIVVLESRRAVVRWEGERRGRAVERLRRVAREAAAQSRRTWLPELVAVTGLEDLSLQLAPVPLALAQFGGAPPSLEVPAVAVGPEGGWEASEAEGRPLVGRGPGILRAETAAMAAGLLLCGLRQGLVGPAPGPGAPSPGTADTEAAPR